METVSYDSAEVIKKVTGIILALPHGQNIIATNVVGVRLIDNKLHFITEA